jgi:hypothetical protein
MPQGCARGKVDRDVTEQYGLFSFDGCGGIASWAAFADKHARLRRTVVVNGPHDAAMRQASFARAGR